LEYLWNTFRAQIFGDFNEKVAQASRRRRIFNLPVQAKWRTIDEFPLLGH
jgi:hypothetical protein